MNKPNLTKNIVKFATRRETISSLLILVFITAAILSMFMSPQLYQRTVHEGEIALKDTYAPYDFIYSWDIDEEKTEKARQSAARAVPYSVDRDIAAEENAAAGIRRFLDYVKAEKTEESPLGQKVEALRAVTSGSIPDRSLRSLLEYKDTSRLEQKTLAVLDEIYLTGYISDEDIGFVRSKGAEKVSIYDRATEKSVVKPVADLLYPEKLKSVIEEQADRYFEGDRKMRYAVTDLIAAYMTVNLKPDEKRTETEVQESVKKVDPVLKTWSVKKNELIIEKGMRVNARHIAQMSQMRSVFRPGTTPTFFLGVLLLFGLLVLIAVIHTVFTHSADFLYNTKQISIVLLNMLFMIVIADFVMRQPQPSYFVPMAGMGMIITLLVGFNTAFLSVVLVTIFIALLMAGKIEVMFVLMVGSVVGMLAVKDARRRGQILWAGLLVGVAKFLAIVCVGLINGMEPDFFIKDGVWGVASGFFAGFLVMGLLPVFEHLFKVPTNISLLELSDLNHPLLKKLAMEAPGTYHHSIMVGNLAESACDAIGANSLLARVGAYYHDIGKIPKAEYFSENEMGAGSKHANLAPSMSALIISNHVKEGVEIAKQHKLNNTIIDFIKQHHGDSLIAYFYQKALEKAEDGTELKEANFRYPGPRPQTKERAIVLLADAVEASSRALEEPTPSSIRNLVRKIINNKFIDGQLDECDLTLKDMHNIADSFVRVLMGIFHVRVQYPEETKKSANGTTPNATKSKQRKPKQKKKS